MECSNFSGEEPQRILHAQQVADSIFGRVVQPEIHRAATDTANWIGTDAVAWTQLPQRTPLSVAYHARQPNPVDRQFHMEGEVRVENNGQVLTVSVKCWARGGRRRDPKKRELLDISAVPVREPQKSWPIAEADEECIGQWVREQLNAFICECQKAQPNQWAR